MLKLTPSGAMWCGQQVKGGDSPPLLCPREIPPGVLCPVLEYCAQFWSTQYKMDKGGREDAQRAGALLLQKQAVRVGSTQPGREMAPGRAYCKLSVVRVGL